MMAFESLMHGGGSVRDAAMAWGQGSRLIVWRAASHSLHVSNYSAARKGARREHRGVPVPAALCGEVLAPILAPLLHRAVSLDAKPPFFCFLPPLPTAAGQNAVSQGGLGDDQALDAYDERGKPESAAEKARWCDRRRVPE